jgi:hypothetical protein
VPVVVLHAQTAGVASTLLATTGMPLLAALGGAALALGTAWLRGWPGAVAAAALGAALLVAGLSGDLVSHAAQDAQRREILATMAGRPGAMVIAQLEEMEAAEAGNHWHLVAAAGEGMLVTGLAATCLLLWRRGRVETRASGLGALARGTRWAEARSLSAWETPSKRFGPTLSTPRHNGIDRPRRARAYPRWMTDPARANSWRK